MMPEYEAPQVRVRALSLGGPGPSPAALGQGGGGHTRGSEGHAPGGPLLLPPTLALVPTHQLTFLFETQEGTGRAAGAPWARPGRGNPRETEGSPEKVRGAIGQPSPFLRSQPLPEGPQAQLAPHPGPLPRLLWPLAFHCGGLPLRAAGKIWPQFCPHSAFSHLLGTSGRNATTRVATSAGVSPCPLAVERALCSGDHGKDQRPPPTEGPSDPSSPSGLQ